MSEALKEARKAFDSNEVPVGAVLVDTVEKRVIAMTHNRMETLQDPTAHAEILAIRQACEALGNQRLDHCDLYVTLEPCPMCAQAISFARIRRLYFAAYDQKGGGVEHGPCIFSSSSCHHKPEIYGGIQETESQELLQRFFKMRRRD